jgi:hypothetical protein
MTLKCLSDRFINSRNATCTHFKKRRRHDRSHERSPSLELTGLLRICGGYERFPGELRICQDRSRGGLMRQGMKFVVGSSPPASKIIRITCIPVFLPR